jgi:uncharacterized membrane protein
MNKPIISMLYVLVMVAVIIGIDIAFFKDRFWERLIANLGIVLVFIAFYLRFIRRPKLVVTLSFRQGRQA